MHRKETVCQVDRTGDREGLQAVRLLNGCESMAIFAANYVIFRIKVGV